MRCPSRSSSPNSTTCKSLAKQVRIPGFRPGKAPAKLLEARVGRGAILQQVVNDALPSRYSEAVSTSEVNVIGQPDIEVTKIEDGEELTFTAEVDVRPEIELPDFSSIAVTVDPVEVNDEDIAEQLLSLRQRFGTLTSSVACRMATSCPSTCPRPSTARR